MIKKNKKFNRGKKEELAMNIGIIVYSQTNHTYSVAQKLKEKLSADGQQ
jgi:hypothetical protein